MDSWVAECGLGEGMVGAGGDEVGERASQIWIVMLLAIVARPCDILWSSHSLPGTGR